MSGASTGICRSNRPGRSSAGSSTSGRLVAAMSTTPPCTSKPSISTSSWLSVCSRSSCPPPMPAPRWRPTASISSMKMIAGAASLACSNRSRTRLAPTPTNISTKSEPEIEKNGTPASPATARASSVLPVPGGPYSRTPLGIFAPSAVNLAGSARNSRISCSSSMASSQPATSANVVRGMSGSLSRALLLPKPSTRLPPWALLISQNRPTNSSSGSSHMASRPRMPPSGFSPRHDCSVPAACRSLSRLMRSWLWAPTQFARIFVFGTSAFSTRISCSPSISTTSVSGSSPLMTATTSEVGRVWKPLAPLSNWKPIRNTTKTTITHTRGVRRSLAGFITASGRRERHRRLYRVTPHGRPAAAGGRQA